MTSSELQTAKASKRDDTTPGDYSKSGLVTIFDDARAGNFADFSLLCRTVQQNDAHILAELAKRKRVLLTFPLNVIARPEETGDEAKLRKFIESWVNDGEDIEDTILEIAGAVLPGVALLEIEWHQTSDGAWIPKRLYDRPLGMFTRRNGEYFIYTVKNDKEGEPLQENGWLIHEHKTISIQNPTDSGLIIPISWLYVAKQYAMRYFSEFLEVHGMPLRLGKFSAYSTDTDKKALLRALVDMGHSAAGIIPDDMKVDFIDPPRASHDPFLAMANFCDSQISKLILGGTLTSTAGATGLGSGVADVQNEVRHDLAESDAKQVAGALVNLAKIVRAANFGPDAEGIRTPIIKFDTVKREDNSSKVEKIAKLLPLGVEIPSEWIADLLEVPDKYRAEAVPSENRLAFRAEGTNKPQSGTAPIIDVLENYPMLSSDLDDLKSLLNDSNGFDDFLKRLEQKGDLTARFMEVLEKAALASLLLGADGVNRELLSNYAD